MPRPNYEDGMTVYFNNRDQGKVIGFGFRISDGTEFWMVERIDRTVFCGPAVQANRVWRAGAYDKWLETPIVKSLAEGRVTISRLQYRKQETANVLSKTRGED